MIKSVIVFPNGMVAVCDENGEQLPDYQGKWEDKRDSILADAGPDVEWYGERLGYPP